MKLTRDKVICKRCGFEVRRKREEQRYCSARCRNASVQERKRRKQARSGDNRAVPALQKRRLVPPHWEAVTQPHKTSAKPAAYWPGKEGQHPLKPEELATLLRRPLVNLGERPLSRELLADIVRRTKP
jgi:endogenous inhibitor of DNA gyrase (YacG/DUF329 family)